MVSRSVFRVSKIFNVPLSYAYKWYTDYAEDDQNLIDSKAQRKTLEKIKERAMFERSMKDKTVNKR